MTLERVEEKPESGTRQRHRLLKVFEEAATRIAVEIGILATGAGADEWGFWVDFGDRRDGIGGLAYSDLHGDTALYLKHHRFKADEAWNVLKAVPELGVLVPRRSGRFWDRSYLPLDILGPEFFASGVEDQVSSVVETVTPALKAIVEAINRDGL